MMTVLAITGCSKDDKLTLSTNTLSLYSKDTEQITASEQSTWSSEDEFVASVSENGIVKGGHVGKTIIKATSENGEAKCAVEVKPKYNTYTEPILEFGASKATIKAKESRTLESEIATRLTYKPDKSTIKSVAYAFENGAMIGAGVMLNTASAMEAADFLIERYLVISAGSGNIIGLMLNNLPSKANMSISMGVDAGNVTVIYAPYKSSTNRSSIVEQDIIANELKELLKAAQ